MKVLHVCFGARCDGLGGRLRSENATAASLMRNDVIWGECRIDGRLLFGTKVAWSHWGASEQRTLTFWLDLLGFKVAAFMHEGDDENLALAQLIEDAPGIGGNLAHLLIVELGDFATAEGRGLDAVGAAPNLACDDLGILR